MANDPFRPQPGDPLYSGVIYESRSHSGDIYPQLSSGLIASGPGSVYSPFFICAKCGEQGNKQASVTVNSCSGLMVMFHWECAGFTYNRKDPLGSMFRTVEEQARLFTPFVPETPLGVIADWLDGKGCDEAAELLRQELSKSGG